MTDISAAISFHAEGWLAQASIESFLRMLNGTRSAGFTVEAIAVLDRADEPTRLLVQEFSSVFDKLIHVDYGDPARTRNHVISTASGENLAFFDGDDLWSENWLREGLRQVGTKPGSIWHPEWRYHFTEDDFSRHTITQNPSPEAGTYFVRHVSTVDPSFDARVLLLENIWSVNCLCAKTTFLTIPFPVTDHSLGLGIEDWSWNIATVCAGIAHLVVPDTVHMIRTKATGSQNVANISRGLLPILPRDAWKVLGASRRRQQDDGQ